MSELKEKHAKARIMVLRLERRVVKQQLEKVAEENRIAEENGNLAPGGLEGLLNCTVDRLSTKIQEFKQIIIRCKEERRNIINIPDDHMDWILKHYK